MKNVGRVTYALVYPQAGILRSHCQFYRFAIKKRVPVRRRQGFCSCDLIVQWCAVSLEAGTKGRPDTCAVKRLNLTLKTSKVPKSV